MCKARKHIAELMNTIEKIDHDYQEACEKIMREDALQKQEKLKEVVELAKQYPLRYESVLHCFFDNKQDLEATRNEIENYIIKGY